MKAASMLIRALDRIVNIVIALCLILALLYGGYALWDTWQVYQRAEVSADLLNHRPTGVDNSTSFEDLQRINPDICAWISVDATRINYPVVQGRDNSQYLNTDIYGNFALSGAVFMDSANSRAFTDLYTLLYGHHMDGGVMFGDVDLFAEREFFDEHDSGTLFLPDGTLQMHIFAYIEVSAYAGQVYILPDTESGLTSIIDYVRANATHFREPDEGMRVAALSTCSSAETNGRALLLATLTESTENVSG